MLRTYVRTALIAVLGVCVGGEGRADELVLVKETRITTLMADSDDDDKLEASGVLALQGRYYVVFDNEKEIAVIDDRSWSEDGLEDIGLNLFIRGAEEAEGIAYSADSDRWILVEEERLRSRNDERSNRNGRVFEYQLSPDGDALDELEKSWLPFNFQRENKGFEGLSLVRREGEEYLLALCEGNDCDGRSMGRTPGNGRIKVFARDDGEFKYVASIALPRSLPFVDFSGMDVRNGTLAVVSQETSALWVGRLDSAEWRVEGDGDLYGFPTDGDGAVGYCNVEGVSWIDDATLVVVSDAVKDDQPESCDAKEQSIHVFRLPVR